MKFDDDGAMERYNANIIAENIYSQVDKDGTTITYLSEIVDHRRDETAVPKTKGTERGWNLQRKKKGTTKGWWLLVELKNGTQEWVKLKDLKESNPIELAQYAKQHG